VFIEGIHDGLNDPEDDEVSVQEGLVNVMTIHQSKGLEFEVVFVLRPDKQPFLGDTHVLEDILDPYVRWPTKPATRRPARLRAAEDAVRLFFVAYSRAKRLLILTGTQVRDWDRVLGQDGAGAALNQKSHLQRIGVHFL
jgi:DNA helicase-2/ATP-dependent DNA helicase PcrA